MVLEQPEEQSSIWSEILFSYYEQSQERNQHGFQKHPQNHATKEMLRREFAYSKACEEPEFDPLHFTISPLLPHHSQKTTLSVKLHLIWTGEEEKFQSCSSLHTLHLWHPKSIPLLKYSHLVFFGTGTPIPIYFKNYNYGICAFLKQVILKELPMGKKKAVKKVCNMTDHE